jgi:peptidyl-tRNA hydrolase
VTNYGVNLNYKKTPVGHVRKSSFSKEVRFKRPQLYCNQTGESVFVGPGAYEDLSSFLNLNLQPCGVKMKQSAVLSKTSDTSNVYSMIGHNLKYVPGIDNPNSKHQKLLSNINLHDCPVNVQEAISISKLKNIRQSLKK